MNERILNNLHESHDEESRQVVEISVVAPCHNEESNIEELERRVSAVCRSLFSDSYEIVLVNDGSADGTWDKIISTAQTRPNILAIDLSRNFGHQVALSAGLSLANGKRIFILDADLQDPPELLQEMVQAMDDGADVVYGKRADRLGDSAPRKAASSIFYRLLKGLSDNDIPVDTGDFRLISRRVLDILQQMPEHHRYLRGMISWVGMKQVPVEYVRDIRHSGETSYPISKLVALAVDGITGFSIRPLRLTIYFGLIIAILSLAYVVKITFVWIVWGISIPGWASVMVAILLLSGIQMLFLGLVGEYVGRIFQEVKNRPLYVISNIVRSD